MEAEYTLFVTTVIYCMEVIKNGCLRSEVEIGWQHMIRQATAHKSDKHARPYIPCTHSETNRYSIRFTPRLEWKHLVKQRAPG